MESRMYNKDIKNFVSRILSAIFFIPCIILPIVFEGYFLYLFYILLLSFMVIELIEMIKISKKKLSLFCI